MTGTSGGRPRRPAARSAPYPSVHSWWRYWESTATTGIEPGFISDDALDDSDIAYFRHLIGEVPERREALEERLHALIDRPLSQLDPVERAIILIGAYEILFRPDIPNVVAINEAVDMAHLFGAKDSYKCVNGVLDRLASERGGVQH